MRLLNGFRLTLLSVILMAGSPNGRALDYADPRDLVETTIEAVRARVNEDPVRIERDPSYAMAIIEDLVSPHTDLQLTGRLALGSHWRNAQPEQRDAFVAALRGLLLRILALHINDYRAATVTYFPTRFKGDNQQLAVVRTTVSREGIPPVRVDYRLHRANSGWKVFDVSIIGVSLVKTYRITIEYDLRKHGLDAIIRQIDAMSPVAGGTSNTADR